MIKPWLFEFFHELRGGPSPAQVNAHFDWYLDLWARCEARGFEGIFFSEHHFGAGYSPSPNLLIATLAPRTTTLRLGVLGSSAAYTSPWRVVEEFGMLDHLTHGRLEMGLVSGIPPEYGVLGMKPPEAVERYEEIADVFDAALRDPVVTHHGRRWSFDGLRLVPGLFEPNKSMWTAVRSPTSAVKAARRGWKICAGFNATPTIAATFDAYRSAASDAGHRVTADHLAIRRLVTFVEDDRDRAAGIVEGKRHLLEVLNDSIGPLPPWAAVLDQPGGGGNDLNDDEFISGTPESVAEQIVEQCRVTGAGHAAVMFGALDRGGLERSHDLFATHVIPTLRAAL